MEWQFAKMARNESRDRSCLAEFFNDSKIFKDFTDALVREDIQNRLDAKRADVADTDPVVVTYRLTTQDAQASAKIQKWLAAFFASGMIDKDDIWLKFTAQLVSLNDLTDESTEAEKDDVIDLAVKTFCEHHQMIAATGAGEESAE